MRRRVLFEVVAHKTEIVVLSLSGEKRGYVVIGIPEEQFRELNAKFPPQSPFAGQSPKVNEAIKDGISDEEADHIRRHLNLQRSTKLKFTFEGIAQHLVDEAKRKPSFVLNGKSFWVFRLS
jgi:hypothetical protein